MELGWTLFECAINLIQNFMLLYFLESRFAPKTRSRLPFVAALLLGAAWLSVYTFVPDFPIPDALSSTVLLAYALLFLEGKWVFKLFWTVVGMGLIIGVTNIMSLLFRLTPGVTFALLLTPSSLRFIYLLALNTALITVFYILSHIKSHYVGFSLATTVLLCVQPVLSALILDFLFRLNFSLQQDWNQGLMLASTGVLLLNISTVCLYEMMARQKQKEIQLQKQLKHTQMTVQHQGEMQAMYERLRGWRHDLKNQFAVLATLLEEGKYAQMAAFFAQLDAREREQLESLALTGRPAVDALIGTKTILAKQVGVTLACSIQLPQRLPMEEMDFCAILGNILDNAIEGNLRREAGEKSIELTIRCARQMLLIQCVNPTDGKLVREKDGFRTSKSQGDHGLGLKNIRHMVEEADGMVKFTSEDGLFTVDIMIPIGE